MIDFDTLLASKFYLFILIFARITGVLLLTPILGGRSVPRRIRWGESLLFSALAFSSLWHLQALSPSNLWVAGGSLLTEFLIGLGMGMGLSLLFMGLSMAGDFVGKIGGFSVSASLDPTLGEEIPTLSLFLRLIGMMVFLLSGGLDLFIAEVLHSFTAQIPGELFDPEKIVVILTQILALATSMALQLASPIILSTVILWTIAGIINRSLPQMNLMPLTFSGNALLSLAVLHLVLGGIFWVFQGNIAEVLHLLFET